MGVYSATKFHFFPGTRRCFPKNFGLKGTVFTKNSQKNRDKPHNFKKFSQNVEKFSKFRAILAKISRKFVKITSLLVQMLNCCPKSEKLSPPPLPVFSKIFPHVGKKNGLNQEFSLIQ